MSRHHEDPTGDLIDFLLDELPPERRGEVAERIAADPETAAARDRYVEALALVRAAAADGWEAPAARRGRLRWLRPAAAVAAVLLIVAGFFWMGGGVPQETVYEPDVALGYLLPEETDADGGVRRPSTADVVRVAQGAVDLAPLGSTQEFVLQAGETVAYDTTVKTRADSGARLDLPFGGILFVQPLSQVRVRRHQRGGVALRLLDGAAAVVADERDVHLAVDGTDLLLALRRGAALLRSNPAEAVALRGELDLLLASGKRFRVPNGERLPAACAKEPQTTPVTRADLDLAWYRDLADVSHRSRPVDWAGSGVSAPLVADGETLLYLEVMPVRSGRLSIAFGGEARVFALREDHLFRLRLRLSDLGPGPRLKLDPPFGIRTALLLQPR